MKSHQIDYQIIGNDSPLVEIALDPNETVIAEAGAMIYLEDGIEFETKMGDGSNPNEGFFGKLFSAGKRMVSGESAFITHFTNKSSQRRHVAFGSPHPGTIMPIDLSQIPQNTLIAQSDSFLCAALGTSLSIHFNKKIGAGLFGGEGFILQKLQGDGLAFLHAGGSIIEKQLNNESLRIDTGCVVAFEPSLNFDIQMAGGMKSMIFGGEGLFLATLSGTGKVWLQSLPFSALLNKIISRIPKPSSE